MYYMKQNEPVMKPIKLSVNMNLEQNDTEILVFYGMTVTYYWNRGVAFLISQATRSDAHLLERESKSEVLIETSL